MPANSVASKCDRACTSTTRSMPISSSLRSKMKQTKQYSIVCSQHTGMNGRSDSDAFTFRLSFYVINNIFCIILIYSSWLIFDVRFSEHYRILHIFIIFLLFFICWRNDAMSCVVWVGQCHVSFTSVFYMINIIVRHTLMFVHSFYMFCVIEYNRNSYLSVLWICRMFLLWVAYRRVWRISLLRLKLEVWQKS